MKRKLPQWLLDATSNNNEKISKNDSPQSKRETPNKTHLSNDLLVDESHPIPPSIDPIQNNGTISVVPLNTLLPPSRAAAPIESHRNVQTTRGSTSMPIVKMPLPVEIKQEKEVDEPNTSNGTVNGQQIVVKEEINDEPVANGNSHGTSAPSNVTPAPPTSVAKVEGVKLERRSCNYGIKCFRRNPDHRSELAHPGDVDYRRPNLPNAPNTPPCPWGAACYRRNPQHFIQLSHPPATNTTTTATVLPQMNVPSSRQRNRNRNSRTNDADNRSDLEDDYDLEDPFIDDGSSDEYVPDGGDEDDDDEDLEDAQGY